MSTPHITSHEIPEKFEKIFQFLLHMKNSKKNIELATEAFQEYFSLDDNLAKEFLEFLKHLIETSDPALKHHLSEMYGTIFATIAEIFGLYKIKSELDDLCFSLLHPDEYHKIKKKLEKYQKKSDELLEVLQEEISANFYDFEMPFRVEGRYKNISSIFKKCKKTDCNDITNLGDIFAFRIIYEGAEELAYDFVSVLLSRYKNDISKYKDYISFPKINGYKSIHLTLEGVSERIDIPIEIQIKNREMHLCNEFGPAAHFLYSREKESMLLSKSDKVLLGSTNSSKYSEKKYCYVQSVGGDIIQLPSHSTVQDFARKIHSELKDKSFGAMSQGIYRTQHYILQDFDIIKLLK